MLLYDVTCLILSVLAHREYQPNIKISCCSCLNIRNTSLAQLRCAGCVMRASAMAFFYFIFLYSNQHHVSNCTITKHEGQKSVQLKERKKLRLIVSVYKTENCLLPA